MLLLSISLRVSFILGFLTTSNPLCFTNHYFIYSFIYLSPFTNRFQAGNRSSLNTLLDYVKSKIYSPAKNATNSVRRILFIITESIALNDTKQTTSLAKGLQNDGVDIFLLTVGKHVTIDMPNMVIGKPFKRTIFEVNSFRDLPRLAKSFKDKGK